MKTTQELIDKILDPNDPTYGWYEDTMKKDMLENLYDRLNIGTDKYMGIAYYWNSHYKHNLRSISREKRKKIHDEFISNGLEVNEVSDKHWEIICLNVSN